MLDKELIKKYKGIDWGSLTRENQFVKEENNFVKQKYLFEKMKNIFDILIERETTLIDILSEEDLRVINNNLKKFIDLIREILDYSDFSKHQLVVNDIKKTCFIISTSLDSYVEYLSAQKEEDLSKIKIGLDKLDKINKEIEDKISSELKRVQGGINKTEDKKLALAGNEIASFFLEQSNIHNVNAESYDCSECLSFTMYKKTNKNEKTSWLLNRERFSNSIIFVIILFILSYTSSFILVEDRKVWSDFWGLEIGFITTALLTILYTGLYFSTKNYNREKDLEYYNKNKANIAETMLLLSNDLSGSRKDVVITEASRTLFSNINFKKDKMEDTNSMNISVPINRNID